MTAKTVHRQHAAHRDDIDDLTTRRPLPGPELEHLDPFLFLNHHGPQVYKPHNRGLPFEAHPHRGFETVTFIVEGSLAHKDSRGHESIIKAGGVQWMTAGGIVHAEVSPQEFKDRGGPLEILQLWVNLPPHLKLVHADYVGLQREDIPAVKAPDGKGTVNLISGAWGGKRGPIEPLQDVFMSTVELEPGGHVAFPGVQGRSVFLYVVRGRVRIGRTEVPHHHLAELGREGDMLEIDAPAGSLLLVGHAAPIGAPVVSYGPFVMNTREEIQQAIRDYQAGRFGAMPA